jgi:hypothetical protein
MADESEKPVAEPGSQPNPKRLYEPPQILWREPYEPVSFGLSCGKQPGNPACIGGPTTA